MKPDDMLHQMCHSLLAATDIKAICKARGLLPEAAKSPGILETLFLSSQGVSNVLNALDPSEIALLHLLKIAAAPVKISYFARAYGGSGEYGTFNQRFQDTFSKVKRRLIRGGLLLWAEGRQNLAIQQSKLERSRFVLPAEFYGTLPPLLTSPREFAGNGDWKPNVAGEKLLADLGRKQKNPDDTLFQITAGELQLGGKRFEAAERIRWQRSGWQQAFQAGKKSRPKTANSMQPAEAAFYILSELTDNCWADAQQLTGPLRIFCDKKVDSTALCETGWEWGLLAKRQADEITWYRPAPPPPHIAPHQYLTPHEQEGHEQEGYVSVDLTTVPIDGLEPLVAISDQQPGPGGCKALLLTPNSIKLGRADDKQLETEPVQWLIEHAPPFANAFVALAERRGKTILHENVMIARVSDLSLKVTIEKMLGQHVVSLKNDFIAFPHGFLPDVQRVVIKSGHVIKEGAAK